MLKTATVGLAMTHASTAAAAAADAIVDEWETLLDYL
jgi:cation transport ATPase